MNQTIRIADKKNTRIVAHRGCSSIERENTIAAFIAAGNRTQYGMECDVHVTKDGKYLIYHDDRTSRLCNADLVIEENYFDVLRALKLKKSNTDERDTQFSDILKIPTLVEYLEVLEHYERVAVIELKNRMPIENIREIIDTCKQYYRLENIIFISFCFENLVDVRRIVPDQKVQFLIGEFEEGLVEKLAAQKFDVDIGYWKLTKEQVNAFHAAGIEVNCWTCDDLADAQKLIEWGVEYITSNTLE